MVVDALDPFGLPIHLQSPASVEGVHGFIEGLLRYEPRILDIQAAAAVDDSLVVQTLAAALALLAESPGADTAALAHLARARAADQPAGERERQWAEAVQAWATGEVRAALARFEAVVAAHPADLAAVKLGQYLAFNLGDAPAMLRLALRARPTDGQAARHDGLLAFAWEQCHRLDEAEAAARRALAQQPDEPWAQHALAHVLLTEGRLDEGVALLEPALAGWRGLTSFMRSHNAWHLALFHLERSDAEAALQLYDAEVWGVDKRCSQDQVGAVSLLARLEIDGVEPGARWAELAPWLATRHEDVVQPFLSVQYLYGLARAGRPEAGELAPHIARQAEAAPADLRDAWRQVALPLAHGLVAHAGSRWDEAAEQIARALPLLGAIGGSHAQRELFERLWIDALERSGRLAAAHDLVQPRATAQPQSRRLARQLARLQAGLGIPPHSALGAGSAR
jgi:tetratricopeptide (TPR) repeat protein